MKDLKTRLKEHIVEWDPVDLIAVTNQDEYDVEINMILARVSHGMSTPEIGKVIRDVFVAQFRDVLQAEAGELNSKKLPKESDGEFSRGCLSVAKSISHYV